ncbi:MAG: NAD(P)/FAD-dependent oxidoreductase [Nitrospirae bacterium]|nr:MAG: NAD(P)/FAD-dependent oxidoreductase [Nitrospirota bacterium]
MKKYDDIVVGSGISGMTMSLLLSMNGHSVLLLEKGPHIGGSLARFSKRGIPFDTGFHFTGGLHSGGILADILSILDIRDSIEPVFLSDPSENQFIFESHGRRFEHPIGIENIKKKFGEYFPSEAGAIERYFDKVKSVCSRTPSLNLHANTIAPPSLDEDYVTLDEVLKGLTSNTLLRGLLSGYAMCYGVRPDEMSFANHSRMCLSFYESIACVKGGGDAFIKAFERKFKEYGVDIRCGAVITELADINDGKVGRFILNTGEEVVADTCVFTIHPKEIVNCLPQKYLSKAFVDRISSFESSAGFFSVFAALNSDEDPYPGETIVSLFPDDDVNKLLDPHYNGRQALVIIKPPYQAESSSGKGICILEPSFPEHVSAWSSSHRGQRPQEYIEYKKARIEAIKEHIFSVFPAYRERLDFVDAGSLLTTRDYLNSPDGSAYGIKQKMGQYNLIGKLPLHNLYAAGQSALLPGIIGAMMSSMIVGRAVVGKEQFGKLLGRALCH